MWNYMLLIFGALAVIGGLAFSVFGLPVVIIGVLALLGGLVVLALGGAADNADGSDGGKPSWMRKHWYE